MILNNLSPTKLCLNNINYRNVKKISRQLDTSKMLLWKLQAHS